MGVELADDPRLRNQRGSSRPQRMKHTVGVVEDDAAMCRTLVAALQRDGQWELQFAVGSLHALAAHWEQPPPDVLLVDLGLPDGDGLDLLPRVRAHWPGCETLVISVFGDEDRVLRSIEAGAGGYILKGQGEAGIAEHMRYLLEGGSPMSPAIARHLLRRIAQGAGQPRDDDPDQDPNRAPIHDANPAVPQRPSATGIEEALTSREAEVLTWLARGEPYDEVARRLSVSVNTVRYHVKSLYGKLGVNTRHHAVVEGQRRGWLDKP